MNCSSYNTIIRGYLERVPEVVDGDEPFLVAVERREPLHVLADLTLAQRDRDRLLRRPVQWTHINDAVTSGATI